MDLSSYISEPQDMQDRVDISKYGRFESVHWIQELIDEAGVVDGINGLLRGQFVIFVYFSDL